MRDDSFAGDDQQVREDLQNLLRFTEQMLATREKTVFDIAEYPIRLTERDLMDVAGDPLPGVSFSPSEDVWLSFARMRERPPPKPPADLEPWLRSEARPTPAKPPVLLSERVLFVTADEATDLIEASFIHEDAVGQIATNPGEPERWSVPLRPAELPSVVEALGRVDSWDSRSGGDVIQGWLWGGGLGRFGSSSVDGCGVGADGAAYYRPA